MPNCKTMVPYAGTPEQENRLREFLKKHKDQPGAVMPVLQETQKIFGYLPEEALIIAAEELDIPLADLYSVASFYTQFSFNPKGVHQVSVCLGTACYVKGASEVLEAVEKRLGIHAGGITRDGRFSLDTTRCIGACGLAPVMTVGNDVYGRMTPDKVDSILDKYM